MSRFVSAGFGSFVDADKVTAILPPDSAPIRRRIQEAKEAGMLIDATFGRKVRTVLYMIQGTVMVCAIATETNEAQPRNARAPISFTLLAILMEVKNRQLPKAFLSMRSTPSRRASRSSGRTAGPSSSRPRRCAARAGPTPPRRRSSRRSPTIPWDGTPTARGRSSKRKS